MDSLQFYNLRKKRTVTCDDYELVKKGSRNMAKATDDDGTVMWRPVAKQQ